MEIFNVYEWNMGEGWKKIAEIKAKNKVSAEKKASKKFGIKIFKIFVAPKKDKSEIVLFEILQSLQR